MKPTDDKELLELAAKAHGGLVYVDNMGWIHEDAQGNRGKWWNPLTDDGDALRLAVKLMKYESYRSRGYLPCISSDLHETKLSITFAAAEIGKAMP